MVASSNSSANTLGSDKRFLLADESLDTVSGSRAVGTSSNGVWVNAESIDTAGHVLSTSVGHVAGFSDNGTYNAQLVDARETSIAVDESNASFSFSTTTTDSVVAFGRNALSVVGTDISNSECSSNAFARKAKLRRAVTVFSAVASIGSGGWAFNISAFSSLARLSRRASKAIILSVAIGTSSQSGR